MLKNLKRAVSLVLVLALSVVVSLPAFAAETDNLSSKDISLKGNGISEIQEDYLKPTNEFIKFIDGYFKNHNNYVVVDIYGNDVSKSFYQDNIELYKSSDYYDIRVNMFDNISYFSTKTVQTQKSANGVLALSQLKNISNSFYQVVRSDDYPHPFEIQYQISGSFHYNPNTGIITDCSDATLKLTHSNAGAMWSVSLNDVSTGSEIASDKYSVTFTAYFGVTATLGISIGDLPIGYTCDYGHYYNSVTGTAD